MSYLIHSALHSKDSIFRVLAGWYKCLKVDIAFLCIQKGTLGGSLEQMIKDEKLQTQKLTLR